MGTFGNPSAITPFNAGYLVLTGTGSGDDGSYGLEFLYGEMQDPGTVPNFQSFSFSDETTSPPTQTSIVTQNGVGKGGVPCLLTLDINTIAVVYMGTENGTFGVWAHVFYQNGATLTRVTALLQLISDLDAVVPMAASTIPGMPAFLLSYLESPDSLLYAYCSLPQYTPGQSVSLLIEDMPAVSYEQSPVGNFSLVVAVNSLGAGSIDSQYLSYLAIGDSQHLMIAVCEWLISSDGTVSMSRIVDNVFSGPFFSVVGLFLGADGLPWWQAWPGGTENAPSFGTVGNDGTLDSNLTDNIPDLELMFNDYSVNWPVLAYFTMDEFNSSPSVGDQETVSVYFILLFGADEGKVFTMGQASRTVFQQDAPVTQQGVLIGFFESGPPIPNENIAALAPGITFGTTTFGDTTTSQTGWSINTSIGGFFQYSSSEGIPGAFSVTQQFKVTFGVNASFSQQSTLTTITNYSANSATTSDITLGKTIVNPQGLALVFSCSYTGYQYVAQYLDGTNIPGSPIYYELYPTSTGITALPFDYDPSVTPPGIQPGNLLSYVLDDAAEQLLEQNLLFGASPATCSWSTDGGQNTATVSITQGTKSVGMSLNFEASIGASIGPPGGNLGVSAGVQASFNFNYTWTTIESDQLVSNVTLPPLTIPPPPGAYNTYSFDVLILAHNPQYTADLITLLQSYPSSNNTSTLAQIAPNSAPWKIMHVVKSYETTTSPKNP